MVLVVEGTILDQMKACNEKVVNLRMGLPGEPNFVVTGYNSFYGTDDSNDAHEQMLNLYNLSNGHDVEVKGNYFPLTSTDTGVRDIYLRSGTNLQDDGRNYVQVGYLGQAPFVLYCRTSNGDKVKITEGDILVGWHQLENKASKKFA